MLTKSIFPVEPHFSAPPRTPRTPSTSESWTWLDSEKGGRSARSPHLHWARVSVGMRLPVVNRLSGVWCVCVAVALWEGAAKTTTRRRPAAPRCEMSTPTERIKCICFALVCAVGTFAPSISYDEHYGTPDWFAEKTNVHPQHHLFAQLFHKENPPPLVMSQREHIQAEP